MRKASPQRNKVAPPEAAGPGSAGFAPWHTLYFLPLPQGQGAFLPASGGGTLSRSQNARGLPGRRCGGQRSEANISSAPTGGSATAENFAASAAPIAAPQAIMRFQLG
jgi:hypothetical protein